MNEEFEDFWLEVKELAEELGVSTSYIEEEFILEGELIRPEKRCIADGGRMEKFPSECQPSTMTSSRGCQDRAGHPKVRNHLRLQLDLGIRSPFTRTRCPWLEQSFKLNSR